MKETPNKSWKNWAANFECQAQHYYEPVSEEEICAIMHKARWENKKVRVHGAGHSFSPIAISDDILISMGLMNKVLSVDKQKNTITCEGGICLKDLYQVLEKEGLSLSNFGVINKQTLSGAISTGTHGSGLTHTSLSNAIISMRLVTGKGEMIEVDSDEKLDVIRVSMGLLGIITAVTLQCESLFYLKSEEEIMDFDVCLTQMDVLAETNEYLKIWWFPHTQKVNVFKVNRATKEAFENKKTIEKYSQSQQKRDACIDAYTAPMFKASLEDESLIPLINQHCLDTFFTNKTRIGTSFEILVHDETVPMIVSEYALDFDREEDGKKIYVQALTEFQQLLEEKDLKLHFPVDLRFASNESSWLSPAYEQRCFYIGMCVREYSSPQIPAIMQAFFDLMEKFGARPHWGKLFDSKINLKKCFPKLEDFLKVKTKLDPHNLLTNKHFQVWFA